MRSTVSFLGSWGWRGLGLAASLVLAGCQRPATESANSCIDPARVNPSGVCTMEYDPVCGCDGKTYSNACQARNAGLRSFTKGECPGM